MILRRNSLLPLLALLIASCASSEMPTTSTIICVHETAPDSKGVRNSRAEFNRAILEKDISAITALLAPDVTLVTGTDSTLFNGRDAQVAIWMEDFEADERAIYRRTTNCVSVSPLLPIALETGEWRGVRTDDSQSFAKGIYSAKWRKVKSRWLLEAEVFSTESCGGNFCPESEAP